MTGLAQSCLVGDGVLNVKKEAGWTSHDVVAKIRHLLGGVKVGHAGTLDPAATGLLPVLIGKGTRLAEYLVNWDKEYRAVLRLGETTDTQDATGTILKTASTVNLTEESIRITAAGFCGVIQQVPPMYSAVKVGGVPLYKSARAGKAIERQPRSVVIHDLAILSVDGRDVTFRAVCSKGTYIRTLCADIGDALSVGGHMLALERTRVGPLTIAEALTVEEVATEYGLGRLAAHVVPMDRALKQLPAAVVDQHTADRVRHGVPVPLDDVTTWLSEDMSCPIPGQPVRIRATDGALLALGRYPASAGAPIAVEKVLMNQE